MKKKNSILDLQSDLIVNATNTAWFTDRDGVRYQAAGGERNRWLAMQPHLKKEGNNRRLLHLSIANRTKQPLFLQQVALLDVVGEDNGRLDLGGAPDGWTVACAPMLTQRNIFDLCIERHDHNKFDFAAADYIVIGNRKTQRQITLGYLTFARQHGVFRLQFDPNSYNLEYFRALCEFDGYRLDPGETLKTETLYINLGDTPLAALEDYTARVMAKSTRKPPMKSITGWGSWDYYLAKIGENDVLENARWMAAHRHELPVDFIQIDHGYQRCEGDWLITNERFPHGLKWISDEIRKLGFKPGIWLCPFLVDQESQVYKDHPDWVIRNKHGVPINIAGYTKGAVYALDCSIAAARKWVYELGRTISRDYKFQYVKLDGANAQPMARTGVLSNPKLTKSQALRMGLMELRKGLGDKVVLLSAFLPGPSVGIVDAMRIGGDVGARWDAAHLDKHHGERDNYPGPGFIARGLDSAMNFFYLHRRWWINDPDYFVVRPKGDRSELTLEEARSWATLVGLSNGLIMLSDRMSQLPRERIDLLTKTLPPYPAGAQTIDYFEVERPRFLHLPVKNETDSWHVLSVINATLPKRTRDYALSLEKIGLTPGKEYLVFDFWNHSFLGAIKGELKISGLPPHHCRVLAIREAKPVPQLLATDMHLTMGGVEIESVRFDSKTGLMRITPAPIHKKGRLFIHLPKGWSIASSSAKVENGIAAVPVTLAGKSTPLELNFVRKS